MNIVELVFDEGEEEHGLTAISLVDLPAIEQDFIALSKNQKTKYSLAKIDEEKRLLVGPALIPNKLIFRKDDEGKPFYVWFSKDTVKKAAYKLLKDAKHHEFTLMHEEKVYDLYVAESWIVESEQDKSRAYGINAPIGTHMVAVKVDDEDFWNTEVKSGKVKGFSIEAYFTQRFKGEQTSNVDALVEQLNQIID